jgi:excisionase family DNA binding protein
MLLLTVEEAAVAAKVSVKTIRRRIAEGRLKAENYGTAKRADWRIAPEALADLKPTVEPAAEIKPPRLRGGRRRQSASGSSQYLPSSWE